MCKARFNRRSTLWNHKRIHSDDKPFECNVCRMTFKWKNSLKCHKEMHQRKNEITGFENDPNEKTLTYATAAKRRHLEAHELGGTATSSTESLQNGGPLITTTTCSLKKRATKSAHSRTAPPTPQINSIIHNNSLSAVDGFIHPPLQADGFFGSQKALSIGDHKELDSLLNSTTRLSTMLKDDTMFKPNICDDLSSFGGANVFDAKQEMSLFHTNPFMVFGTHQLQPSMQNFAPASLQLPNSNASCGDYFGTHATNQSDQLSLTQPQQPIAVQPTAPQPYHTITSTQNDMIMNPNVITYQPRADTPSLIAPTIDYSITPTNLDYMIGNYPQATLQNGTLLDVRNGNEHIQYPQAQQSQQQAQQQQQQQQQPTQPHSTSQQSETIRASERADDGKEVPQVSW
ncbi:unnamed protein product [Anisakis simplex]|uniref:Zinc finger protein n=1 Tax=Anisakis simplex TaxID=6269 RepID=A0A0M3KD79_ANISI|nr:unnamed protein product [Anisakis simplex]